MMEREESPRRPPLPKARRDLVLQEVGEEGILHDRDEALVHFLNLPALHVWRLCDGARSIDEIAETLKEVFSGTEKADVRRDVEEIISRFAKRGLLEKG